MKIKGKETLGGMYDPAYEHDACGVGLLANVNGRKSHRLVEQALQVLEHMVHRGAEGADPRSGDGAGIMVQIPHEFILLQGVPVPEKGRYGTGIVFLPRSSRAREIILDIIEREALERGLVMLAVRDVPVNESVLGGDARDAVPHICQVFISDEESDEPMELRLYMLRKIIEKKVGSLPYDWRDEFYICSLSSKMIVYKGMLSSTQLRYFYHDLMNPRFTAAIALVHSRFSTNTFPSWKLAQPFRIIGHNGEINTIRGNRLWMSARETHLRPEAFGGEDLTPILQPGMSDSASLDNALEYFVMAGMSLPQALAMMVPESFNDRNPISGSLKAFYEYHSILMEAWDGPAAILFSDGRYAGGMLDRNGLRPARYLVTVNDTVVIASETGVLPFEPSEIKEKGRLRPGKMMLVDIKEHRILHDEEIKQNLAGMAPFRDWLARHRVKLDAISSGRRTDQKVEHYSRLLGSFMYHKEEIDRIILPMTVAGAEPVHSMGDDTPLAVFSPNPHTIYSYFRQQFAQVTNPPVDPLREELVMSLDSYIGAAATEYLEASPKICKMVLLKRPVISNRELDLLCHLRYKGFEAHRLDMTFPAEEGAEGLERSLIRLCREAEEAVDRGCSYLVLSDRGVSATKAPIPSLLATSAVHHHLIEVRKRMGTALVIETGDAREVMHFALLVGFGASAINPYMAFAIIDRMVENKEVQLDFPTASRHYIEAVDKGLLKVMSKMGISTLTSYKGARLFEAVGLDRELCEKYFGATDSKIGGIGLDTLSANILKAHREAWTEDEGINESLPVRGQYSWRPGGEPHAWAPEVVKSLRKAVRENDYEEFLGFSSLASDPGHPLFIRDCFDIRPLGAPIDISQVESEEEIFKRFVTGAMSFGSISREAHESIAEAMNAIGARSNTGEGGEDASRFVRRPDGTSVRSAIKQIASGRFGVTTEYLVNADEIQIKVAQGAKPGEGGQLPGFKVDEVIARTRHSIPGITLISPPPHHDIYSIEDLSQLIFDLKNVNPDAKISVKLVSESGVGTIAAGVAKAKADLITISGSDGGTGASPASSIRYAGTPAELGLAETQQTLVRNNLRGQVRLQVDGQIKTARDVLVTAMLGTEEFGFSTSVLIALGCVMCRRCHTNTCSTGIATQNPALREKFAGNPGHVITYFRFLATHLRGIMARLGIRRLDEIIGRADLLTVNSGVTPAGLDLSPLLHMEDDLGNHPLKFSSPHAGITSDVLDRVIIARAYQAIEAGIPVEMEFPVSNTDRAVGAMLSGVIARKHGGSGLPDPETIKVIFKGSVGQSFGAFLVKGVSFRLEGDANDYVGKGLSGGRIVIVPGQDSPFMPEKNIIAGNTILYGATSGEVYINGMVGERFCVRNSGATAVVEGVGDHCCEYMTGGRTVVLGPTGRNFAAGMSGGIAYIYDPDRTFDYFCNMESVELTLVEHPDDAGELHRLVSAHYRHTRSPLARRILDDWDRSVRDFIEVIPIEYRKVLRGK